MWLKKLNIQFHGHVINDLKDEEIIGTFYEKELQKANQKNYVENVIKKKGTNNVSNGKVVTIHLIKDFIW